MSGCCPDRTFPLLVFQIQNARIALLWSLLWRFQQVAVSNQRLKKLHLHEQVHDCLHFLSLQRDEATRQRRELSQELVNLRGQLGKLGHLGHIPALFKAVITNVHTPSTGSALSALFWCVFGFLIAQLSQETFWIMSVLFIWITYFVAVI